MSENNKWSFNHYSFALADTGDYDYYTQFTNGKDVLQSSSDEIEDEQCQQFCELLDLMPDLFSHSAEDDKFWKFQYKEELVKLKVLLIELRDKNMVSNAGDEMINKALDELCI